MSKFLEFFEPIQKGNTGLTEEAIYKSIEAGEPFIPIWGGNKDHSIPNRRVSINGKTKTGASITVFKDEGVIISLDGSAGSMTFKSDTEFSLNHHAGFFTVRSDAKNRIVPHFFVLFYSNLLKGVSVSEGSKTLTLDQIYSMDFDIPPYHVQQEVMLQIQPFLERKEKIERLLDRVAKINAKYLSHRYRNYQATDQPVNQLIGYVSGNSGLTEEFIYQKLQLAGKRYNVLASSTEDDKIIGTIPLCEINGKRLKVFEDKDGLLVIRKGRAGNIKYLNKGLYAINDDAYILFKKEDCPYAIDLKWLSLQYREDILSYASSSDNGTWNMTGFFKNVVIDVPDYDEQMEIVKEYEKLKEFEAKLKCVLRRIENIFSKIVVM